MPLFARGYKVTTRAELERRIKDIEEKSKKAKADEGFDKAVESLYANIEFAATLNLISLEQEIECKKRIKKAVLEQESWVREHERKVTNDNIVNRKTISDERSARCMSMDEVRKKIEQEKANTGAQQCQNEQIHSAQPKSTDEEQRAK